MLFDQDDNKYIIDNVAELYQAYYYYYDIWDNWHHFKQLPHGKGWIHELPWVIDFLKFFNIMFSSIEAYTDKRSRFRNG